MKSGCPQMRHNLKSNFTATRTCRPMAALWELYPRNPWALGNPSKLLDVAGR